MKKRIHQFLSVLLSFVLLAVCIPYGASAAEIVESGTLPNSNVNYVLDSDGLLTFSGTGELPNWRGYLFWMDVLDNTTAIVVEDGITGIALGAFSHLKNLTSVTLSSTVTSIGACAFASCSVLKTVNFPVGLQEIGVEAFQYCSALESVILPAGFLSVDSWAFCHCESLQTIVIPDSIRHIGQLVFRGTAYADDDANWDESGVLYIGDYIVEVHDIESDTPASGSVTVRPGTKLIAECAFHNCPDITDVILPDSLTCIEMGAFLGCTGLTGIHIPKNVTEIGKGAFGSCFSVNTVSVDSENTHFSVNGNCLIDVDTKTLLFGCNDAVIPADGSVTTIAPCAFAYDYTQNIAETATPTTVHIPAAVTDIESDAFSAVFFLQTITVDSDNPNYSGTGNCLIDKENKKIILGSANSVIPADGSVTTIGSYSFFGNQGLTEITIPDSVTVIENGAFQHCSNLQTFVAEAGVTKIGEVMFNYCDSLQTVTVKNPECEVFGIYAPQNTVLYGYLNSTLQTYAREKGNKFIELGEHNYITHDAVPAGCGTAGASSYRTCANCDYAETPTVIPATGNHTYVTHDGTPATCGTAGTSSYRTCANCDYAETPTVIPATGNHVDADENGFCDVCNQQIQIKEPTFFEKIKEFFENLFSFFLNLFS